jgi:hypothetical protein
VCVRVLEGWGETGEGELECACLCRMYTSCHTLRRKLWFWERRLCFFGEMKRQNMANLIPNLRASRENLKSATSRRWFAASVLLLDLRSSCLWRTRGALIYGGGSYRRVLVLCIRAALYTRDFQNWKKTRRGDPTGDLRQEIYQSYSTTYYCTRNNTMRSGTSEGTQA